MSTRGGKRGGVARSKVEGSFVWRWRTVGILLSSSVLLGMGSPHSCNRYQVEVLSSPPEYVSGDDARIAIQVPRLVAPGHVEVRLNGVDVTDAFALVDYKLLEGVVSGLELGDNLLEVDTSGESPFFPTAEVVLTNPPITGPMFSGPHQAVFLCSDAGDRANAELGPAIDADCSVDTVVSFKYRTTGGAWARRPWPNGFGRKATSAAANTSPR